MSLQVKRTGFGQVEPNHMSGIVTGQILAQLPVSKSMGKIIENGRFAKYDYAKGEVNLTGDGEWMMIYNEEKLYDERRQPHKNYAMEAVNFIDGEMVPRLISTVLGDIFTTNCFGANTVGPDATVDGIILQVGDKVVVDTKTGYLKKAETSDPETEEGKLPSPVFQVVKEYTMADGQPGVKLMRIA